MDTFIRTVIGDLSTINVELPAQVEQWTQILGVSEEELRHAVDVVGVSARSVRRYLRRRNPEVREIGAGVPSLQFAHDADASRANALLMMMRSSVEQRMEVIDEFTRLVPKLVDAIRQGRLLLDYAPPPGGIVLIPGVEHPQYLQALLYWRIRLEASLPRLVEAHARLDGDPNIAEMREMLLRIEGEERESDADKGGKAVFEVSREGALPDGIYKVHFTTDSRALGDGVCLLQDDRLVGATFGYAVSGVATLDRGTLVLSVHYVRQHEYQSPLNLPANFDLELRGVRRSEGFEVSAMLPGGETGVQIAARRVSD